jgi:hypothetical protein
VPAADGLTMVGTPTTLLAASAPRGGRHRRLLAVPLIGVVLLLTAVVPAGAESHVGDDGRDWDPATGEPPPGGEPDDVDVEAPPERVSDGLEYGATSVYFADVEAGVIRVSIEITVRNVKPSRSDGYRRISYYFTDVYHPVPLDAVDIVATSAGRELAVSFDEEEETDWLRLAEIDLPRSLFYRQSRTVTLEYSLPGGEPRSEADVMVNGAHISFPVFAFGDSGATQVTVSLPSAFDAELIGPYTAPETVDDRDLYVYDEIASPFEFVIFVSAENLDGLVSQPADVDGLEVVVGAWPSDEEWSAFMAEHVPDGLDTLGDLIGIERPDIGTLEVRESAAPYLYGYAGWYNADEGYIEVGDELDEHVLFHELSHIWFNDELFTERWITEGLANDFAARTVEHLGIESDWEPESVAPFAPGAVRLNAWSSPRGVDDDTEQTEHWSYNAAWYVISRLREEIGDDALAEILAAVSTDVAAYRGEGEPEVRAVDRNWQRLLDLAEEVAGSELITRLYDSYVLTDSQKARVERRAESRERYQALVERGAEWAAPAGVRSAMDRWRFPTADELIAEAEALLDLRDELTDRAGALGLPLHDDVELAYQAMGADGSALVRDLAEDHLGAMETVASARSVEAADRSFTSTVGLWFSDPVAELAEVEEAYREGDFDRLATEAAELEALIAAAAAVGRGRLLRTGLAAAGVLAVVVAAIVFRRRRRRNRPAAAPSGLSGEEVAADRLGDGSAVLHGAEVGETLHRQQLSASEGLGDGRGDGGGNVVAGGDGLPAGDDGGAADRSQGVEVGVGPAEEDAGLGVADTGELHLGAAVGGGDLPGPELDVGAHGLGLAFREGRLASEPGDGVVGGREPAAPLPRGDDEGVGIIGTGSSGGDDDGLEDPQPAEGPGVFELGPDEGRPAE